MKIEKKQIWEKRIYTEEKQEKLKWEVDDKKGVCNQEGVLKPVLLLFPNTERTKSLTRGRRDRPLFLV